MAGRAVRAVNLGVAIDAAAANQAVAPRSQLGAIVDGRRMPGADVTGAFMIVSWVNYGQCLLSLPPQGQT